MQKSIFESHMEDIAEKISEEKSSKDPSVLCKKDRYDNPLIIFNAEEEGLEISKIKICDSSSLQNEDINKSFKFKIDLKNKELQQ